MAAPSTVYQLTQQTVSERMWTTAAPTRTAAPARTAPSTSKFVFGGSRAPAPSASSWSARVNARLNAQAMIIGRINIKVGKNSAAIEELIATTKVLQEQVNTMNKQIKHLSVRSKYMGVDDYEGDSSSDYEPNDDEDDDDDEE